MSISSVDSSELHVKHPVDLNIVAQANRILYVLNKIILRAKIVGLLEHCVKREGRSLKKVLDTNNYYFIVATCEKYLHPISERERFYDTTFTLSSESDSRKSRDSDKDSNSEKFRNEEFEEVTSISSNGYAKLEVSESKLSERNDTDLSKVIYMLEEHPEIRALAENAEKEYTPAMKFFLQNLKEFKQRIGIQLHENATEYKKKEMYLRETFEKNEKAKSEIDRLEEELLVTKTDANMCLIGRHILIKRHENKIERIKRESTEAIDKRVHESEKLMVKDWKESLIQQERLKQDFNQASEKYSNMLNDHLSAEKILRNKRTKIENQVLGWIQKFDQEIGEKQAEEEEIQGLLDKEINEVNEIQTKLDEQEEEYEDLMLEKVEYEEEMLERRLYNFVMNRSARRIQRTFRLYKARRLARKLAKKGKKNKKKGKN